VLKEQSTPARKGARTTKPRLFQIPSLGDGDFREPTTAGLGFGAENLGKNHVCLSTVRYGEFSLLPPRIGKDTGKLGVNSRGIGNWLVAAKRS
jgi:hypothetical protein